MTERELRDRLRAMAGEIPAEAHTAFLNASFSEKGEKKVRKKWTAGLIVAFALIVLSMGAALAASDWDIARLMDIWRPYEAAEEDPTRALFNTISFGESKQVSFTVRQAYHDGHTLYSVTEAAPRDANTVLLGVPVMWDQTKLFQQSGVYGYDEKGKYWVNPDGERNLPMKALGPDFADSQQTLGEWMDAEGKNKIVYVFSTLVAAEEDHDPEQSFGSGSYDWALQRDGSLLIFRGRPCFAVGDTVTCGQYCFAEEAPRVHRQNGYRPEDFALNENLKIISFTVKANEAQNTLRKEGPFAFANQDRYRADWVLVSVSPFGLEVSVSWQFPAPECLDEPDSSDPRYEPRLPANVGFRIDQQHATNRENTSYSADLSSDWGRTHRNCYGVQEARFPDLTSLPDILYLTCYGEEVAVRLTGEEP